MQDTFCEYCGNLYEEKLSNAKKKADYCCDKCEKENKKYKELKAKSIANKYTFVK